MALSDSVDFIVTRDEIITAAMQDIGVLEAGGTPTATELTEVGKKLNMMVKNWMGPENHFMRGMKMWQRARKSITLDTTLNAYTLKASGGDVDMEIPVDFLSINLRISSNDTPLRRMTLQEYEAIPIKTTSGQPSAYYYERHLDYGELYLDVKPSVANTLETVYWNILDDFDAAADNPDFPQEYYRPLVLNLGIEISPKFGVPVTKDMATLAQVALQQAQTFGDQELPPTFFEPLRMD